MDIHVYATQLGRGLLHNYKFGYFLYVRFVNTTFLTKCYLIQSLTAQI